MIGVLCFKASSFCVNEPLLYPRNVVGILTKQIFLRSGIFLNDHDNVVFAWIFCIRNMACPKMGNDVLTLFWSLYTSLCACNATLSFSRFFYVIIEQGNCCVFFFNGLSMGLICNLKGLDTACKTFSFHR